MIKIFSAKIADKIETMCWACCVLLGLCELLPLELEHLQELLHLDFHHRDPFDRLLIAQAAKEKMTMISKDENFGKYKAIELCW